MVQGNTRALRRPADIVRLSYCGSPRPSVDLDLGLGQDRSVVQCAPSPETKARSPCLLRVRAGCSRRRRRVPLREHARYDADVPPAARRLPPAGRACSKLGQEEPPMSIVTPDARNHAGLAALASRYVDVAALPWVPTRFKGVEMKTLMEDKATGL